MLYNIVGFDPGETTGVVAFTIFENDLRFSESHELDIFGVGSYLEDRINDQTIVCYEVANKLQASGHVSSEIIGLIKYFGGRYGSTVIPVTQSSHKKLISRDVLKRAGLYVKGTHAKDAAGVGLFVAVVRFNLVREVLRPAQEAS